MSLRHLAREIALQALFNWDFEGRSEQTLDEIIGFSLSLRDKVYDKEFPSELFEGVIKKVSVIDDIIEKAAPAWPIDRIASVDRNILRLGIYEMLFSERKDVPPRVAINESIELAKSFGGPNSYKFVSGVLGSVYEASNLKEKEQAWEEFQKDPNNFPIEQKAGAIVFAKNEQGTIVYAAVEDVFKRWAVPKKVVGESESTEEVALEAVEEDLGITDAEVVHTLSVNKYINSDPVYGKIRKEVHYFVAKAPYQELELNEENATLTQAGWLTSKEFLAKEQYPDVAKIIKEAIAFVEENHT